MSSQQEVRNDLWRNVPCPCCGQGLDIAVAAPKNVHLPASLHVVPSDLKLDYHVAGRVTRRDGKVVSDKT